MKRNDTTTPIEAGALATPSLYRIPTVMHLLDVSQATIYRMVAKGELRLVKLSPRASRITSESVERVMSGRKEQG